MTQKDTTSTTTSNTTGYMSSFSLKQEFPPGINSAKHLLNSNNESSEQAEIQIQSHQVFHGTGNTNTVRKRSKGGCITCKLRKKRCDEAKPVCGDCKRLGRKCAYITGDMSKEEVKKLKAEMEAIEGESKTRKRRPKGQKTMPTLAHNDANANDTNANDTSSALFQVDIAKSTANSSDAKKDTQPDITTKARTISGNDSNKARMNGKPVKHHDRNVAVQIDISGSSSNMSPPRKKTKSTQYHHSPLSHPDDHESKYSSSSII
ncbi:unnamed protein product [Ambrosiozyma monospora]|uniref:Unnamed protein product n=1 Tax=Ambrosiozyma monospora TaxID=43982 RepID=A0A9W6WFB8_AMBMO|nr:unnamed protein product [Ambrosiozyma monospora]